VGSLAEKLAEKIASRRVLLDHAIVQHCPIACFILQLSGALECANERFVRLVGYTERELMRKGIGCVIHPKDAKTFDGHLAQAVEKAKDLRNLSHRIRTKSGKIIAVFINLHHINEAGFVGFMVPICDRPEQCPLQGNVF